MAQRVDDQIGWYDNKSLSAQNWFKALRAIEIVAAGLIPFIIAFADSHQWATIAVGALGVLVTALASILSLNQFQENWIDYRKTCESLKQEKFLFLTGTEPYDGEAAFPLLVQRVESLISKENRAWSQHSRAGAEASQPIRGESSS